MELVDQKCMPQMADPVFKNPKSHSRITRIGFWMGSELAIETIVFSYFSLVLQRRCPLLMQWWSILFGNLEVPKFQHIQITPKYMIFRNISNLIVATLSPCHHSSSKTSSCRPAAKTPSKVKTPLRGNWQEENQGHLGVSRLTKMNHDEPWISVPRHFPA